MRKCENLGDLEKYEKMRHFSLSEALIQPRTSLEKSDVSWPIGQTIGHLFPRFAALLASLGYVVSLHTAAVADAPVHPDKFGNHVVARCDAGGLYTSSPGMTTFVPRYWRTVTDR